MAFKEFITGAGGSMLTGFLGQAFGGISTAIQNKRNREFQLDMYEKQKKDNLDFWQMQNEYNSPIMQIQRYKEAGLNPALLFGGSPGQATQIAPPAKPQYSPNEVKFDPMAVLQTYLSTKRASAEIENMQKQGALIEAQTKALDVKSRKDEADITLKTWNIEKDKTLLPYQIEQIKSNTDKAINDVLYKQKYYSIDSQRWELQRKQGELTLTKMASEIANVDLKNRLLEQTVIGEKYRNAVARFEAELAKNGFTSKDPVYVRMGASFLQALGENQGLIDKSSNSEGVMDAIINLIIKKFTK